MKPRKLVLIYCAGEVQGSSTRFALSVHPGVSAVWVRTVEELRTSVMQNPPACVLVVGSLWHRAESAAGLGTMSAWLPCEIPVVEWGSRLVDCPTRTLTECVGMEGVLHAVRSVMAFKRGPKKPLKEAA